MASNFHVQKPYVLTALPRPLDPTSGRYVVGEVYGTTEGSRKRKRSEVTVGIDGEAVNIYDVGASSSNLHTLILTIIRYPLPDSLLPTQYRRNPHLHVRLALFENGYQEVERLCDIPMPQRAIPLTRSLCSKISSSLQGKRHP
jgi:hypothetical protein